MKQQTRLLCSQLILWIHKPDLVLATPSPCVLKPDFTASCLGPQTRPSLAMPSLFIHKQGLFVAMPSLYRSMKSTGLTFVGSLAIWNVPGLFLFLHQFSIYAFSLSVTPCWLLFLEVVIYSLVLLVSLLFSHKQFNTYTHIYFLMSWNSLNMQVVDNQLQDFSCSENPWNKHIFVQSFHLTSFFCIFFTWAVVQLFILFAKCKVSFFFCWFVCLPVAFE